MNKEQWMWMRASVALLAAACAQMRRDARAATHAPATPAPKDA